MSLEDDLKRNARLESLLKLRDLLRETIGQPPERGNKGTELGEAQRKICSAINISHLLLKWAVDAYDNEIPEAELAAGFTAIQIHINATDSYAGTATSEEAKHVVEVILQYEELEKACKH